jgi:hypothetical protein
MMVDSPFSGDSAEGEKFPRPLTSKVRLPARTSLGRQQPRASSPQHPAVGVRSAPAIAGRKRPIFEVFDET